MIKEHVESVAGSVRLEALAVVRHHLPVVLELDPDRVVRRPVTRAVHAEPHDEDPPVHTELDAVTPAPVSPLVGSVGRGLEPVTRQGLHALPRLSGILRFEVLSFINPPRVSAWR